MAVTLLCGFEMNTVHESDALGSGLITSLNARSGTYCSRADVGVSEFQIRPAGGTLVSFAQSVRFYMLLAQGPASAGTICMCGSNAGSALVLVLNTNRTVSIIANSITLATSTNAVPLDSAYHRFEFDVGYNAGAGAQLYVDGVSWALVSTGAAGAVTTGVLGNFDGVGNLIMYMDDVIFENGSLGGPRAADYNIVLLFPVSDNARGTNWLGGAGGTTNLFNAVKSAPPLGVVSPGTNTSQIGNAQKDTTGNYDANCTSYTAAGIGAGDTINNVQAICSHAFSVTGTQLSGAVVIVSNPSGQTEQSFDFGNNGVIAGTYPTGWRTMLGPVTTSPTVTKGTQPVVRVGRRTGSKTTNCMVDFMGIYVEYTPAVVVPFSPPPPRRSFVPHIRASHWFSRVRWAKRRDGLLAPALTSGG